MIRMVQDTWHGCTHFSDCFSPAGGTVPAPPSQQTVERPCEGTAAK